MEVKMQSAQAASKLPKPTVVIFLSHKRLAFRAAYS